MGEDVGQLHMLSGSCSGGCPSLLTATPCVGARAQPLLVKVHGRLRGARPAGQRRRRRLRPPLRHACSPICCHRKGAHKAPRGGQDAAAGYQYGRECLFRFYSYGLEEHFDAALYRDFEQETLLARPPYPNPYLHVPVCRAPMLCGSCLPAAALRACCSNTSGPFGLPLAPHMPSMLPPACAPPPSSP